MDDAARLVRAGHRAVAAAEAEIVIHGYEAVLALIGRSAGTHRDARRLRTVLTADHQEQALDVGVAAHLDVEHLPPLHARQGVIGVLAGGRARLAADAAIEIDDHAITRTHGDPRCRAASRRMRTRAMSDVLPVASVSSSASDCTEFKLGTPRSLATGVAQ